MAAINSVADLAIEGEVALVTISSPPVNALSQAVRDGLKRGVEARRERRDHEPSPWIQKPTRARRKPRPHCLHIKNSLHIKQPEAWPEAATGAGSAW